MLIDENLIFVSLITIFSVFIVYKQPYLICIIGLISIFYYLYKSRFTNPKDFLSFIKNKVIESFEPCSSGNPIYCDLDATNSNMTYLPSIMNGAPINNNINNMQSIKLKLDDYQINKGLILGNENISIDQIIKAVPPLIEHKLYQEKLIKFIIGIKTDDNIQKDFLAKKICNKMTKIFYTAYSTISDKQYIVNTYNELLYAQREFNDTLDIFVFLGMNESDTNKLGNLQKEFKNLNDNLNEFIIEKVNTILPNDYNITTSFLPQKDEPIGISVLDNYININ